MIEEEAQWDGMDHALALSAVGDSTHAPLFDSPPPPSPLRPLGLQNPRRRVAVDGEKEAEA